MSIDDSSSSLDTCSLSSMNDTFGKRKNTTSPLPKFSDRGICPHPISEFGDLSPRNSIAGSPSPRGNSDHPQVNIEAKRAQKKDAETQTSLTGEQIEELIRHARELDSAIPSIKNDHETQFYSQDTTTDMTYASCGHRFFLLGGATECFISEIDEYDYMLGGWRKAFDIPPDVEWMSPACTSRQSSLYVIGEVDFEFSKYIGIPWKLDIHTGEWAMLPSLQNPRVSLCLINLPNAVFALGGSCRDIASDAVEYFDPEKQSWFSAPKMDKPRAQFSAIYAQGAIYAFGGMTSRTLYRSGEYLDPREARWHKCKKMRSGRTAFGCAVYKDAVYLIGGFASSSQNSSDLTSSTEVFEIRKNEWRRGPDLNYPRGWCTSSILGEEPCVIGGKTSTSENQPNAPMEVLNLETNEWTVRNREESRGPRAFCSSVLMPLVT